MIRNHPVNNTIKFSDVKAALQDAKFRDSLPETMLPDVQKFLRNPGCACNAPIYRKVLQVCADQLRAYYPSKLYESPVETDQKQAVNNWKVINCAAKDLESKLRALGPGRKQVAIARHEDQVTVVINELDIF
jgi:hypothetical protein